MSLLAKAQTGTQEVAQFYVIYSAPGVGKSTLASEFPSPIFFDFEKGSLNLNVTRLTDEDVPDLATLEKVIEELSTTKHSFKTLVIDQATALEKLIESAVCLEHEATVLSDIPWGGGPIAVGNKLQGLITKLKELQLKKNMHIVVLSHSTIKQFTDPQHNASYDRYILQTSQKFGQTLTAAADNVFFIKFSIETTTDSKTKKTKAFSDGSRVIYTEYRAAFEAKNRFNLPFEIPFELGTGFSAIQQAIKDAKPRSSQELKMEIADLLAKADDITRAKVNSALTDAGDDSMRLSRIKQKLQTIVNN